jgi:hypothetical protein
LRRSTTEREVNDQLRGGQMPRTALPVEAHAHLAGKP